MSGTQVKEQINTMERKKFREKDNSADELSVGVCVENDVSSPVPVTVENVVQVEIVDAAAGDLTNIFNKVTNVASGTPTTVVTYTVPIGKNFYLKKIQSSGNNRAKFTVKIAGLEQAIKRTYQPVFNADFDFFNFKVVAGVIILVEVEHSRSAINQFDARIIGNLV